MWVAGPNITPGYWNRPDATAAAFELRWLKTGDAARKDEEGFIYIVDRWKDMYISGGENVYPAEIENVLYQLPQVAEAAIIGVPNDKWGEVGLAAFALKPGTTIDRATVVEQCVSRLAKFKIPNDIAIIEALPRNATGKALKRELRTQFLGADAPKISYWAAMYSALDSPCGWFEFTRFGNDRSRAGARLCVSSEPALDSHDAL